MSDYPLTFKAAILEQSNRPLVLDEVTFPGPLLPGQVLVRVHYSGICGKQIEEITAAAGPDPFLPHLLGHEGGGIVQDIGPGVTHVKPGDHVVMHWLKGPGIDSVTPRYLWKDHPLNAGWITTFNQYAVVSENRLTVIPDETDLQVACLLGCAATTGLGAVINDANVRPGESVAVVGCGGVGLFAVHGADLLGAHPIIAVDTNPAALELASALGDTDLLNPTSDDVTVRTLDLTAGLGCDVVILATPAPAALELGVALASAPSRVLFVAVPPADTELRVDALAVHRGRMVTGSCGGGTVPARDIPRYLELQGRGRVQLDKVITQTVPLAQINEGLEALRGGQPGRCVVDMTKG